MGAKKIGTTEFSGLRCTVDQPCDCEPEVTDLSACTCDVDGSPLFSQPLNNDNATNANSSDTSITACLSCTCSVDAFIYEETTSDNPCTAEGNCRAGPTRPWRSVSLMPPEFVPVVLIAACIAFFAFKRFSVSASARSARRAGSFSSQTEPVERPLLDADYLIALLRFRTFADREGSSKKRTIWSKAKSVEQAAKHSSSSVECAICLSPFTPETMVAELPKCGHVFCAECLTKWVQSQAKRESPLCPLCKEDIFEPTALVASSQRAEERAAAPEELMAVTVVVDGNAQPAAPRTGASAGASGSGPSASSVSWTQRWPGGWTWRSAQQAASGTAPVVASGAPARSTASTRQPLSRVFRSTRFASARAVDDSECVMPGGH